MATKRNALKKRGLADKQYLSGQCIVLAAALLLFLAFFSVPARAGTLSKKKLTLVQTQTKKLKLKGASGKVTWSSTDPAVAEVSAKGKVRALQPGSCRIKAVCGGTTYKCRVKVKALELTTPSLTLVRGRQAQLAFNLQFAKGTGWTSSAPKVATVDAAGVVRAKIPGTATITAEWKGVRVQCTVIVTRISANLLAQAYPATKANRGKIVLAGSSSMDYWNEAAQAFAPYEVINTAIGGTTVVQWLGWYKQLITRYKPKAVVLYVGSNDLGNGQGVSGEANAQNTIKLLKKISKKLKKTPVFYVSVNPCWSRKGAWEAIAVSNRLVQKYCAKKKNLYYIDITAAFALPDGTPNPALFLKDRLHPSEQGYAVWQRLVAKKVKKTVKKYAKSR